jgi:acylphosphatase
VIVRRHVWVSGRVQGVWFRQSTRRMAGEVGLSGWGRNLPDGRVEAVFEGEESAVVRALDFVRAGPPHARVVGVEVREEPPEAGGDPFEVR